MIVEPIKNNQRFFFGTRLIEPSKIGSISIYSTEEPSSNFIPTQPGIPIFDMIAKTGSDVTRDFTILIASC